MVKNLIFGVLGVALTVGNTFTFAPKNIADKGTVELNRVYVDVMNVDNVIELEDETYLLFLEDVTGNIWEYETDADDYIVNDSVGVLMDNMGTVSIYDDEVIGVNYSGWTLSR